jgi:CheY-like chemotaxis protein
MANRHVLIIDDDPDIRDLVQMSLESVEGWRVSLAVSGEEGTIVARESQPDVILLDVMMPGMDGPTTFKALRDQDSTRDIPVVLLTANPQADERYQATLELSGLIAKPFNPFTLPKRLAEILGW